MGLKTTSSANTAGVDEASLWLQLANDIWKNVLRDHPDYTGYDLEDTTPGYGRDPITKDICLRAQELLNALFIKRLLNTSTEIDVVASPDGDLEFEWWWSSEIGGEGFSVGVTALSAGGYRMYAGPFPIGNYRFIDSLDEVESAIKKIAMEE